MVVQRTDQMEVFLVETLRRMAVMAELKDPSAIDHPIRVGELAAEIAAEMGESPTFVNRLRLAARLHDIGKVALADQVLFKPGALTHGEYETVKMHTTLGAALLADSPSLLVQLAAELTVSHHERWDGAGYPNGLEGDDIPLSGRIVTVADVYDALVSVRVYKPAWSSVDAVNHVVAGRGTQFDPRIVAAFISVMCRRDPSLAPLLDLSALA